MKRKPEFFVVGAQRCGTTALHQFLREHPQIFMPKEKELQPFGSDLHVRHTANYPKGRYRVSLRVLSARPYAA